jgi:hypothetical protein
VREPGPLHDVGAADAVETALAKQPAGRPQHPVAMFGDLFTGYAHDVLSRLIRMPRLYMTIIMNKRERNEPP